MDTSIFQTAGSLGVGAFLGALIFIMYRYDRKASEDRQRRDRMFTEDRLTRLLEQDQDSRKKNTRALTELTMLISKLNGRLDR